MKDIHVLIVEDDEAINNLLYDIVVQAGYRGKQAFSGTEAKIYFKEHLWDVILLDLMLPGLSGEELLKFFRQSSDAAILVVSAKEAQLSKVSMLRAGADDYITKPFDTEELSARIDAQLRRHQRVKQHNILTYKDVMLNLHTKQVTVNGKVLSLTSREYYLLKQFLKYPDKLFTKRNLFESVWGESFYDDDNTVNVHMSHLRRKLSKANADEQYIETIWGMGYRLK